MGALWELSGSSSQLRVFKYIAQKNWYLDRCFSRCGILLATSCKRVDFTYFPFLFLHQLSPLELAVKSVWQHILHQLTTTEPTVRWLQASSPLWQEIIAEMHLWITCTCKIWVWMLQYCLVIMRNWYGCESKYTKCMFIFLFKYWVAFILPTTLQET